MTKIMTSVALAGVLAIGLSTSAMAGKGAIPGGATAGTSPTEIAATIQTRVSQATGLPVTVTANVTPSGITYTVNFGGGRSVTVSSATVAFYMAMYS